VAEVGSRRELGRGERVLPGVYRLRLPLPWPGVPHCNAWAVRQGEGFVLFDTGLHGPGSIEQLERALAMCGLRLEDARLVAITHAHSDHYGQAATVVERAGCELWMHPDYQHMQRMAEDPDAVLQRRLEIARQSGVPEEPLRLYAAERADRSPGIAAVIPPDRPLHDGVVVDSDLGEWVTYETPGHAPSHVCFFQPERRLLISGDHLLGRISLYYDYGWTPDPVGEFLASLDLVEQLGARLCLAGHGRPFVDVRGHIEGNRKLVQERLDGVRAALGDEARTVIEIVPHIYDEPLKAGNAALLLSQTLCYLRHLELAESVEHFSDGESDRWRLI
jgi:glyoxylase-like metal-dependent hydrolase (beta-lactamase superfamily II)